MKVSELKAEMDAAFRTVDERFETKVSAMIAVLADQTRQLAS